MVRASWSSGILKPCVPLGILLIVVGLAKLLTIEQFGSALHSAGLFPDNWIRPISVLLIIAEIVLGIGICLPKLRRPSLIGAGCLFSSFAAFHGLKIAEGIEAPCACFGPLYKIYPEIGVPLNVALTLFSLLATQLISLNPPTQKEKGTGR